MKQDFGIKLLDFITFVKDSYRRDIYNNIFVDEYNRSITIDGICVSITFPKWYGKYISTLFSLSFRIGVDKVKIDIATNSIIQQRLFNKDLFDNVFITINTITIDLPNDNSLIDIENYLNTYSISAVMSKLTANNQGVLRWKMPASN